MTKIDSHLTTSRSLLERIDTAWKAGLFSEVENLCRLLNETTEMIRVHARVADRYPQVCMQKAALSCNRDGTIWELRCEDGRSTLHFNREDAENRAKELGWETASVTTYADAI